MRAEDKELKPEESLQQHRRIRDRDKGRDLAGLDDNVERDIERGESARTTPVGATRTLDVMHEILTVTRDDRRRGTDRSLAPDIKTAGMDREEAQAIEMLTKAAQGRDRNGQLVYAEDRKHLLEHALAALYPSLQGLGPELDELRGKHAVVIEEIVSLRDELVSKEDAQEDQLFGSEEKKAKPSEDDEDEEDEEDEEEDDDEEDEGDEDEEDEEEQGVDDEVEVPDADAGDLGDVGDGESGNDRKSKGGSRRRPPPR